MKSKSLVIVSLLLVLILSFTASDLEASYRTLQQGMDGRDVRELQENLVMLGEGIVIDGKFGPATRRAVINFQQKSDLIPDGVVGRQTWNKLKEAISFDVHKVRRGDSLSRLAATYNVPAQVIREANNLNSDMIRIGQELIIPKTALGGGIDTDLYDVKSYSVQRGDTLERLASRYNTTVRTIKNMNNFTSDRIRVGQEIKIPQLILNMPSSSNVQPSSNSSRNSSREERNTRKSEYIWPVRGRITSGFGYRIHPITNQRHFHGGIDIAVPKGTPVKASRTGTVLSSGWIRGFGETVTIDHGDGIVTLYAHNSRLLVRPGQRVNQGDIISKAGSTGVSTGPHVDFRILIDNEPVNPMEYLD
ncbi:peptidoglycan DD-metalloendopeptidase family protein [Halonatronum saccharophilum]|uniref:peptidoglycan DD-metalloendopeptidase family protein n=1 Tax=Halonatronum saccharophilum TaxID=150060 RepID=UPI000488A310|nr:peptidoglycan DD-metalloendopeptidase family protein [Halonatronum saccharophilum]